MASGVDDQPIRRAVISGIGQSDVGRRLFRPAMELTLDAAVAAVADAGLTMGEIDGLATYPGGLAEVHDALRLQPSWYGSGAEGAAQLGPVINAAMAVGCGLARHVLVYRTVTEGSDRAMARAAAEEQAAGSVPSPPRVDGPMRWLSVYGVTGAPQWYAFYARRYMHDFGLTREQLAQIPIAARTKAALNPRAVYRDPITVDDYLACRMISDPICLFDCDVPCDGSTAFVVSRAEHAGGTPHGTVRIDSVGAGAGPRMYRDQLPDAWFGARAAEQMWSRTTLAPGDVDVAELYDGFSFITVSWLESLGFCGRGEAGGFLEGGTRIGLHGDLPLNTDGGQLAAGRLHGLGLLHEACVQLRHEAGARQVADAEVAVVTVGGQPNMGCVLLTADR